MRRRFQFSLRWLLIAIALVSILLGSWQIYTAHFATHVEAVTRRVGQPVILRGRFSLKDGASSVKFQLAVVPSGATRVGPTETFDCRAERSRFGIYTFSEPVTCLNRSSWTQPGVFDLLIFLPDGRYIKGHVTVEP